MVPGQPLTSKSFKVIITVCYFKSQKEYKTTVAFEVHNQGIMVTKDY